MSERERLWSVATGWTDPDERLRACMALAVEERAAELRKAASAIQGGNIYDDYQPVAAFLCKRADDLSAVSS